jgi:hypothetical protein
MHRGLPCLNNVSTPQNLTLVDHQYLMDFLMRSMHINLLWSHQQWWTEALLPRKRAPDPIHSTTADRSMSSYPVSLPKIDIEVVGVKPPSVVGRLQGLQGWYLWHAISTFNTCLRGPTHRSLTDIGATTLEVPAFHITWKDWAQKPVWILLYKFSKVWIPRFLYREISIKWQWGQTL